MGNGTISIVFSLSRLNRSFPAFRWTAFRSVGSVQRAMLMLSDDVISSTFEFFKKIIVTACKNVLRRLSSKTVPRGEEMLFSYQKHRNTK